MGGSYSVDDARSYLRKYDDSSSHRTRLKACLAELGSPDIPLDSDRSTCLHACAQEPRPGLLKFLLADCDCDQKAQNLRGETALDVAIKNKDAGAVAVLVEEAHVTVPVRRREAVLRALHRPNANVVAQCVSSGLEKVLDNVITAALQFEDAKHQSECLEGLLLARGGGSQSALFLVLQHGSLPCLAKVVTYFSRTSQFVSRHLAWGSENALAALQVAKGRDDGNVYQVLQTVLAKSSDKFTTARRLADSISADTAAAELLLQKLIDAGFVNEIADKYAQVVELLSEAKCLPCLPTFLSEKMDDSMLPETEKWLESVRIISHGDVLRIKRVLQLKHMRKELAKKRKPRRFSDVIGQAHCINILQTSCIAKLLPLLQRGETLTAENTPAAYRRFLVYGPPGTGKSFISEVVASELNVPYYEVQDAVSSYYGGMGSALRSSFDAAVALAHSPDATGRVPGACVVILNEFDSLANAAESDSRNAQFHLQNLNAVKTLFEIDNYPELIIMASVNRVGLISDAIKRRFPTMVFCSFPSQIERAQLLSLYLRKHKASIPPNVDVNLFAEKLRNCTGGIIEQYALQAAGIARRRLNVDDNDAVVLCAEDLTAALRLAPSGRLRDHEVQAYMKDAYENDPETQRVLSEAVPAVGDGLSSLTSTDHASEQKSNQGAANSTQQEEKTADDQSAEDEATAAAHAFQEMFFSILNRGVELSLEDNEKQRNDALLLVNSLLRARRGLVNKQREEGSSLDLWQIHITYIDQSGEHRAASCSISKSSTVEELTAQILREPTFAAHKELLSASTSVRLVSETGVMLPSSAVLSEVLFHRSTVMLVREGSTSAGQQAENT